MGRSVGACQGAERRRGFPSRAPRGFVDDRIRTRLGWDEPASEAAAHGALPPERMRRVLADAGL